MIMDVRQLSQSMGAKSIELYPYNGTWKHVCWTGGQLGQMRQAERTTASDGTQYGMCPDCRRFFYAIPKRTQQPRKQFAYAYGSR